MKDSLISARQGMVSRAGRFVKSVAETFADLVYLSVMILPTNDFGGLPT
jgi:hypothetical protein